jgi:hypothetical protein
MHLNGSRNCFVYFWLCWSGSFVTYKLFCMIYFCDFFCRKLVNFHGVLSGSLVIKYLPT